MGWQGKAVVWLYKLDDDNNFEYSLSIQSGEPKEGVLDDLHEAIGYHGRDFFDDKLKKMKPGDWIRYDSRWEFCYNCWTDYYSGGRECDLMVWVHPRKTLKRGHYRERYARTK